MQKRYALVGRGPGKEAAVGRVDTAAEVALWPREAWERFIHGRGIQDTNTLGRTICLSALACVVSNIPSPHTCELGRLSHGANQSHGLQAAFNCREIGRWGGVMGCEAADRQAQIRVAWAKMNQITSVRM